MANVIRGLVSKKKRRFQENGFDLDLSYICDRIIAMGFPSEKLEGIYRNPFTEVKRFLDSCHPDKYKVYNLCSERKYDIKKFNSRVMEFPFDDHNCPELHRITDFCEDVHRYLESDPGHVVVIHCKAGKGRTGLMICCYLMYSGRCATASEALQLFAQRRTLNQKGVTLQSQRRYVSYYEKVLHEGPREPPVVLRLDRIRMHTIPDFKMGGGSEPWFAISRAGRTIYYSEPLKGKRGEHVVDFECNGILLSRDIKVEFFHKTIKGLMCYTWFHASYINNNYLCLRKRDLERAAKDKQNKHFSPSFKLEFFFSSVADADGRERTPSQVQRIGLGVCTTCNKNITANDQVVNVAGGLVHWDCLRCDRCGRPFNNRRNCVIQDGVARCEKCDDGDFFSRCAACSRILTDHDIVERDAFAWHRDCFRCAFCREILDHHQENSTAVVVQGIPYCANHEGMLPGSVKCAKAECRSRLAPTLSVFGKDWHPECFRCLDCDSVIDTHVDEFTQKNDGAICAPMCHLATSQCFSCQQTIGNKREMARFMGETWHQRCFACASCSQAFASAAPQEQLEREIKMRQGRLYCAHHETHSCVVCAGEIEDASELVHLEGVEKEWHARCFTCHTCKAPLVASNGSSFVVHEGAPSCKRHHLKCFKCGKQAARDEELVSVAGNEYHAACLVCELTSCGEVIEPSDCIAVKNKLYCSWHPHCGKCRTPIREEELLEHPSGGAYHTQCFVCSRCSSPLAGQQSEVYEGEIVCAACHPMGVCAICNGLLSEQHIVVLSSRMHYECFRCISCAAPFESTDEPVAVTESGQPICQRCSTIECAKCHAPITGEMVEALGSSYHITCFVCQDCRKPLTEEFATVSDAFVCRSCAEKSARPKCGGCNRVIAGRYTIAGKSYFHSECFKCTQCEALFPTGNPQFFTDGKGFYCHPCHEQIAAANRPAQARSAAEVTRNYRKSTIYKSPTSYVEKTRTQTLPPEIQALIGARTAGGAPAVSMSHFVKAIDSGVDAAVEFEKKGGKKEGFLKKKGAKRRNWKRRYFKLAGQTLSYHKTAEAPALGTILLSGACAVNKDGSRENGIALVTSERTFYLVADDDVDQRDWIKALQTVISTY